MVTTWQEIYLYIARIPAFHMILPVGREKGYHDRLEKKGGGGAGVPFMQEIITSYLGKLNINGGDHNMSTSMRGKRQPG